MIINLRALPLSMQDLDFFTATEHAVTLSGNGDGRGCLYGIATTDAALRV